MLYDKYKEALAIMKAIFLFAIVLILLAAFSNGAEVEEEHALFQRDPRKKCTRQQVCDTPMKSDSICQKYGCVMCSSTKWQDKYLCH